MNFFRYFWDAIRGFRSYRTFMEIGVGSAIGYWTVICLILCLIIILELNSFLLNDFPGLCREAASKVPAFRIEQGHAVCSLPQPFLSNTNQFPIILDMEGSVTNHTRAFPSGILIRKNDLTVWKQGGTPFQSSLQSFPEGEVNANYLIKLGQEARHSLPFLTLIIWPILLIAGLFQASIFTLLATVLENSIQPRFSARQLFNFAVFALTPGTLIVTAYSLFNLTELHSGAIYFSCYGLFLILATGACRIHLLTDKQAPPPDADE